MASVASQLMEEVAVHAQRDSLEDAREVCADGTYFPNNLRISMMDSKFVVKIWINLTVPPFIDRCSCTI